MAMLLKRLFPLIVLVGSTGFAPAGEEKALTAIEARKKVGERITVEMTVQTAKDRLENRGEIYLDAEMDFRDEKNFAVVITKAGAASLKHAGIDSPADHFKDKKIRATGTVKEVDQVPRIEIDDARQIKLVKESGTELAPVHLSGEVK
jgi:DNA/RNA endonuclease YhcR with UshA esterase domain